MKTKLRKFTRQEAEDESAAALAAHNEAFDRWERMTEKQREAEIRDALRTN